MPTSASSWQCLKLVGSTLDLLPDRTNLKEVAADNGDLIPKPDATKSLVRTYFGFVAGADGSPTLSFL